NLVSKDEPCRSRRAASHHVLIAPADVRAHDFENHAVLTPLATRIDQPGKVDAPHLYLAGLDINNTAIACHDSLPPRRRARHPAASGTAIVHAHSKAFAPASATAWSCSPGPPLTPTAPTT